MQAPLKVNFLAQVVQLKHNLWTDKLKISTRSFGYALFWQTEHLGAALILNPRGMVSATATERSFNNKQITVCKLVGRQAAQPEAAGIYDVKQKDGMLIVERCNVGGWNGRGIGE
jgi:hypothetical protein